MIKKNSPEVKSKEFNAKSEFNRYAKQGPSDRYNIGNVWIR